MRLRPFYPDKYYDSQGDLGAPYWFWLLLLWQTRAWWEIALMMAGVSFGRSAGDGDLPWWGGELLAGVPAIAMVYCYTLRGRQRVSRWSYLLLTAGAGVLLLMTLWKWYISTPPVKSLWLSLSCFDVVLFSVFCGSRHLKDVFWTEKNNMTGIQEAPWKR
ncbi:TPA: hypothetical protein ACIUI9_004164 [Salmonella enterica subsp. enterica serovar 13,23:b:-]|nr:DUF2919 domain-containing protein [Salmonella enterica subsp. enterica]